MLKDAEEHYLGQHKKGQVGDLNRANDFNYYVVGKFVNFTILN